MHYEDSNRSVNLIGGLLIGAVLGAALALAVFPRAIRERGRRSARAAEHRWHRASRGASRWREDARDSVVEAVAAGRDRLRG